jgi:anaerobic selenocysteine-containing dehydrogenase
LRLVVESAIFSGGGTAAFDARVATLRPTPRARLHPQTAAQAGIADGDLVDIIAADGTARITGLTAVLSGRAAPGTIGIIDGLPAAPANALDARAGIRVVPSRSVVGAGA